jgi:hypothetical protein
MAMAEMDLGNAIFEYGQTYVALSRIQTLDGLYLSAFHPQRIKANPKVRAFYDSIATSIAEILPVEEMSVDWKQFAKLPEDANIKVPALVPPTPPLQNVHSKEVKKVAKDPNVKVIRL